MKPRVVLITTAPETLRLFFQAQIRFLCSEGFSVETICSPGADLHDCRENLSVEMHEVRMQRRISPVEDAVSLLRLVRKLKRLRPAIVHTHTPKAGLLGIAAARLSGVPVRIYTINGLRFSTCSGFRRAILSAADKLGCWLATDVLAVSETLRRQAIAFGICPGWKVRTLGYGGSHGVDPATFDPECRNSVDRHHVRSRYGLPQNAIVVGYFGRIVQDKGVADLVAAWKLLRDEVPSLWLFLCGTPEATDPVGPEVIRALRDDTRICFAGEIRGDMPAVYAAIDICILPSYREGLPNVMLEAQAMRVPVVATRIAGTIDAVRHGTTGFLVEPRDYTGLVKALKPLIQDEKLRFRMGAAGRAFVTQYFSERKISELLAAEYRNLLVRTVPSKKPLHRHCRSRRIEVVVKRTIDVFIAAFALAVGFPWLLLIGITLRRSTKSSALFRQMRTGLRGQCFILYKFRTMTEAKDADGVLLSDAQRLKVLGRLLRAVSLDEVPQLWNVLRGDMSLVGPRPLLPEYLPRYTPFQYRRHELKPGITGWAQVNGRNSITWERKFELDVWYVDHWSLWLDLKILALTVSQVLRRDGINQTGRVTMAEFQGNLETPEPSR
jgi:lipopolysaccharide/colanic/teichoic acid biosynthesis glycosyltransferase/glycosyltransferase involved in cell wall biosynthesis